MDHSPINSASSIAGTPPPSSRDPALVLDFSAVPLIYLLPAHFGGNELHDWEDRLLELRAPLTYDIAEAKIVVGKVGTKRRAQLELRSRQIWTEEVQLPAPRERAKRKAPDDYDEDDEVEEVKGGREKKRRIGRRTVERESGGSQPSPDGSETVSDAESIATTATMPEEPQGGPRTPRSSPPAVKEEAPLVLPFMSEELEDIVMLIKIDWMQESLDAGRLLPLYPYVVYVGKITNKPDAAPSNSTDETSKKPTLTRTFTIPEKPADASKSILERAKADAETAGSSLSHYTPAPHGARRLGQRGFGGTDGHAPKHEVKLLQQTTSEYEGQSGDIPEPPDWVKEGLIYSCQRSTPADPPNAAFIEELKKIRLARTLMGDEIGIRAYSTSIAALAAYPYPIITARQILQLPGCDVKIANLWIEWKNHDGAIAAVRAFEADEGMAILRTFYNIWGVGATTAREFYYDRGWRDLDDVVEFGWAGLSRVQQIGVKYYDEFLDPIPRAEVEAIGAVIRRHAVKVRDTAAEVTIVGGHRRGKPASGDVDVIVSHPNLTATAHLVTDLVASLEEDGWITHTLLLALTNSQRGQATLPYQASGGGAEKHHGQGFDTLDKALVVWQDPHWDAKGEGTEQPPQAPKNPNLNPHRRVDIIVSPWRTRGCAIAGWSSGTTFQRDLRRYARREKGWKFDSSGVRDRRSGVVVPLEGPEGVAGPPEEAERCVFEGLGLVWRAPEERCTG